MRAVCLVGPRQPFTRWYACRGPGGNIHIPVWLAGSRGLPPSGMPWHRSGFHHGGNCAIFALQCPGAGCTATCPHPREHANISPTIILIPRSTLALLSLRVLPGIRGFAEQRPRGRPRQKFRLASAGARSQTQQDFQEGASRAPSARWPERGVGCAFHRAVRLRVQEGREV